MPKGRPAKKQIEVFEGHDTAIAFKAKYFPTLKGFNPAPSIFPGHFGIMLKDATVYFREIPIAHNIVAGVVGADESFKTITASVFSLKLEDETQMLQLAFRWGDSYYSVWLPYNTSNLKRMEALASEILLVVTEKVLAAKHISRMNVKALLGLISDRLPHATIVPAGDMTDELIEFVGELSESIKDIDRFIRPGLSRFGEVPKLKSKEQLAREAEANRLLFQKYTKEEILEMVNKDVRESMAHGAKVMQRSLLGATREELDAMPVAERDAFIANYQKECEEAREKARAAGKQRYEEMLEQQKNAPVVPVAAKKTRKIKAKIKSKET